MKLKLRRGCYDKFHRCPGWVGGGSRYPKEKNVICQGGSIVDIYDHKLWKWRFNRHKPCGTIILPYATRYLDPFWIAWAVERKIERIRDWEEFRQYRKTRHLEHDVRSHRRNAS